MSDLLLASRIVNAGEAILGRLTRPARFALLAGQPELAHLSIAELMALAKAR